VTSAQQVDVEMKHRLPRARAYVEHGPISLLDVPLARNLRRREVTAADHFGVFSLGFFQTSKMFFRNNQHMRGSLRIDVLERKHVLVLVDFLGGNLTAKNAAEKAIGRGVSHFGRWRALSTLVFHHEEAEKTNCFG
jgi:hypothetical protein